MQGKFQLSFEEKLRLRLGYSSGRFKLPSLQIAIQGLVYLQMVISHRYGQTKTVNRTQYKHVRAKIIQQWEQTAKLTAIEKNKSKGNNRKTRNKNY